MPDPILSIIIPCYNDGQFLQEALLSITSANLEFGFEIIVVNDGSNDQNTLNILNNLGSSVKVITQNNKGLGSARNNGIENSIGDFILPLDSDNKINAAGLVEAINYLRSNDLTDILYSDMIVFDDLAPSKTKKVTIPEYNREALFLSNYIDACALYKKNVWVKLNGYDEKMPYMGYEDWDFWLRSSINNFKFEKFKTPLFKYRIRSGSMIHSKDQNERHIVVYKYLISKFLDHYVALLFNHRKKFSFFLRKPLKAGILNYLNIPG